MDYMDPDVLCSQKADKLNLSLSLSQISTVQPLKLGNGYVISPNASEWM